MSFPLAPYPTPPAPYTPPANGVQSQLVCSGCRNLLVFPVGATSVCCAVCNAVTAVPPPGTEMAQLVCGGCHTLLMYIRGATSVQCSCCHTVNLALEGIVLLIVSLRFKELCCVCAHACMMDRL
uniref:Zinc finger LSD1-type domain-containing protein n=1 Tax=Glycine max TaxID=3847 RepID=A0A0R0JTR3_SOYBN